MTAQVPEAAATVAVSVSESPDMGVFGLSKEHLQDATTEIALQMLSSGISLAYGGDLRPNGFTELLFELIQRYQGHPDHSGPISVTNYLAWPVHIQMPREALAKFRAEHTKVARLVFLARDGAWLERAQWESFQPREPGDKEWADGLTSMRMVMRNETQARIVLGGRMEGYKGRMPGIAEETLLSLQAKRPVFLIGGFGGCTRGIAEVIGVVEPWAGSRSDWNGRSCFESYSASDLYNGLSEEENALLAQTPHIQQAVALVYRGLRKTLFNRPTESNGGIDA